jgi:hypothetical protein
MVLTGYFDESGTHGSSPITLMAGYLADARQWRNYEKRTARLFQRFKVDVFHHIAVRRGEGCFAGWSVDQKAQFTDEYQHIVNDLEVGIASIIRRDDYAWYRSLKWSGGAQPQSLYAVLACHSLLAAIEQVQNNENWATIDPPTLNIVLERGHKNSAEVLGFYDQLQAANPGHWALGSLTFQSKSESLPIASADLMAYTIYGLETGAKMIGTIKGIPKSVRSYRGNAIKAELTRDFLEQLYHQAMFGARKASA